MGIKDYIRNVFYALDCFCNAILVGDPEETMSSRMGRHVVQGQCVICKLTCRMLDVFWPNHCVNNIKKENKP